METGAAQTTEALIHDYSTLVFHVIYGLTGHWQESEDLTQETFVQAFRGIDAARAASGAAFQPKAWLLRIALNTVRMQRRRQHGLRFFAFSDLPSGPEAHTSTVDLPISAQESIQEEGDLETVVAERDAVQRSLAQLPETLRLPLLLSLIAGFSAGEIARTLDLKEAAVRQRLTRARQAFQQIYTQESGEELQTATTPAASAMSLPGESRHQKSRSSVLIPAGHPAG